MTQNYKPGVLQLDMRENFTYSSLRALSDEVRLLCLHSGNEKDPLECSLTVTNLSKMPPYVALSYAWGANNASAFVQLNGVSTPIQKSLCEALQHLRSNSTSTMLWADALCINQNDDKEKSSQIPLMRRIYENAVEVRAWLGPEADDSEYAMTYKPWDLVSSSTRNERTSIIRRCYSATIKLLLRSWWQRIWVIQEVAVAKQVHLHCGRMVLNWTQFDENITTLDTFNRDSTVFNTTDRAKFTDACNSYMEFALCRQTIQEERYFSLQSLLVQFRELDSTKESDKVYALLGLASDGDALNIIPDYSKSFQEVYISTAKQIILQTKSLKLMVPAGPIFSSDDLPPISRSKGVPSWVPDWSNRITKRNDGSDYFDHRIIDKRIMVAESDKVYAAGGSTEISVNFVENDTILQVEAALLCCLGSTDILSKMMRNRWNPDWPDGFNDDFLNYLNIYNSPFHTGEESTKEAFYRMLATDRYDSVRLSGSEYQRFTAWLQKWDSWRDALFARYEHREPIDWTRTCTELPSMQINGSPLLDVDGDFEEAEEIHWSDALRTACGNYSIFRTDSELVGLATFDARDDDMLCIPIGGEVPWIIRPLQGGYYEFVDECYVAGIMDGQMMERLLIDTSLGEIKVIELR